MQPGLGIELEILTGIQNIESAHPEHHCRGEQQDARIERGSNRDPRSSGGDSERESKNKMRPAGESFRVGVQQQDSEREGAEKEREMVQLPGSEDENRAGDDDKRTY